jgi:hypothetical protein
MGGNRVSDERMGDGRIGETKTPLTRSSRAGEDGERVATGPDVTISAMAYQQNYVIAVQDEHATPACTIQ